MELKKTWAVVLRSAPYDTVVQTFMLREYRLSYEQPPPVGTHVLLFIDYNRTCNHLDGEVQDVVILR